MNFKQGTTGAPLSIDEQDMLGQGAFAKVYRIKTNGFRQKAAKIYTARRPDMKLRIAAMLSAPPENSFMRIGAFDIPQFAWPIDALLDAKGELAGYLMPEIERASAVNLDRYYDRGLSAELGHSHETALTYRLEIACNLTAAVAELHKLGHYVVDFKPQNIKVFKRTHLVCLLDCDGFSINASTARFAAGGYSSEYICPEAIRSAAAPEMLGEAQDRYGLAVLLFQLLNNGTHPYQGIVALGVADADTNDKKAAAGLYPYGLAANPRISPRPQSVHRTWHDDTRRLFDRAFMGEGSNRPSAAEWLAHWKFLLETKALQRCDKKPNDPTHIRFADKPCAECHVTTSCAAEPAKVAIEAPLTVRRVPQNSGANWPTTLQSPSQSSGGPINSSQGHPQQTNKASDISWWVAGGLLLILAIWAMSRQSSYPATQSTSATLSSASNALLTPSAGAVPASSASPAGSNPLPAFSPTLGTAATNANLRSGPTSKSQILRVLTRGTLAERSGSDGTFFRVRLDDGVTGWIAEELLIAREDVTRLTTLPALEYVKSRENEDRIGQTRRTLQPLIDRELRSIGDLVQARDSAVLPLLRSLASETISRQTTDLAAASWYTLSATTARSSGEIPTALQNYIAAAVAAPDVGANHSAIALAAYEAGEHQLLGSSSLMALMLAPETTNAWLVFGLSLALNSTTSQSLDRVASGAMLLAIRFSRDAEFTRKYLRGLAAKASDPSVTRAIEQALSEEVTNPSVFH